MDNQLLTDTAQFFQKSPFPKCAINSQNRRFCINFNYSSKIQFIFEMIATTNRELELFEEMRYFFEVELPSKTNRLIIDVSNAEILKGFAVYSFKEFPRKIVYKHQRQQKINLFNYNSNSEEPQFTIPQQNKQPKTKTRIISQLEINKSDNQQIVVIETENYLQWQSWQSLFQHVVESLSKRLTFYNFTQLINDSFQKVISPIKYSSLTQIQFKMCPITNIEILLFLDLPNLQALKFYGCLVSNLKSLAKADLKNLSIFELDYFPGECSLNDLSSVSRISFAIQEKKYCKFRINNKFKRYLQEDQGFYDLRLLTKFQLSSDRKNQVIRRVINEIIFYYQGENSKELFRIYRINQYFDRLQMPERFIQFKRKKLLLDRMARKLQRLRWK